MLGGIDGDLPFAEEEAVKVPEGGEMPSHGAAAEALLVEIIDMKTDFSGAREARTTAYKGFKTSEIAGIGIQGIGRKTLFKAAEIQKGGNLVAQL